MPDPSVRSFTVMLGSSLESSEIFGLAGGSFVGAFLRRFDVVCDPSVLDLLTACAEVLATGSLDMLLRKDQKRKQLDYNVVKIVNLEATPQHGRVHSCLLRCYVATSRHNSFIFVSILIKNRACGVCCHRATCLSCVRPHVG